MSKKTCIVIPCYNEARRLAADAFLAFLQEEPEIDLCFVNDGSRDGTIDVLKEICADSGGRAYFVDNVQNQGKAEAVRSGINHILGLGKYSFVGFLDADLATPLCEVPRLMASFGDEKTVYAVIGSRVKRLGARIERKVLRHYVGRMFAATVALVFRLNTYDTQCGAKVFDADIATAVFAKAFVSKWLFDVELLLRIQRQTELGLSGVKEMPLDTWIEKGGSKIKPTYFLKIPFELARIRRQYGKKTGRGGKTGQ